MLILILVVVTAICFDFTNGFHDTADAVATSIATGALKPRVAVLMSWRMRGGPQIAAQPVGLAPRGTALG